MRRILTLIAAVVLTLILIGYSASPVFAAPAITLSRTSGPPGSSVTITASGFSVNETGITVTYDGVPVVTGIAADAGGAWTSSSFTIPASASGNHIIDAYGTSPSGTTAASVPDAIFIVTPAITINRSSGPPGISITVNGAGFGANEAGITVTYDGASAASGISANAQGAWTSSFTIPASPSGSHAISASSSAGTVGSAVFTVSPLITINRTSGVPGSAVTITGVGFGANEGITVTFDGTAVPPVVSASNRGSWTANYVIPALPAGTHAISASGSTSTSVTEITFTVTPVITLNPNKGSSGSSITITGAGFGANEAGITVTYDGTTVASDISANDKGSWKATFVVPASTAGAHTINVSGSVSAAGSVPGVTFTLAPIITIDRTSGAFGSTITVAGSGFAPSEKGITVTYDGKPVASDISANALGVWKATFFVPASAAGSHTIGAYGSTTGVASLEGTSLSVTSAMLISPAAGHVGIVVEVTGSGFTANSNLRFTYDNIEIPSEGTITDATGSFSKSITVPKSKAGTHTIKVVQTR